MALLLFLLAALAVNQQDIALEFLVWRTPTVSVFWWLLAAFAAGLALGLLGMVVSSARLGLRNRSLSRRIREAEGELRRLRSMMLQE